MLEPWLAAREAAAVRAAWTALSPRQHQVGTHRDRTLTRHGAAMLAEAMLGERADWIVDVKRPPDFAANRVVDETYFDQLWDGPQPCHEVWKLWEQRDGDRGVQVVEIGAGSIHGQPDGSGMTFVRVFDHDRAASIAIDTMNACTIGEVDLAPIDLLRFTEPSSFSTISLREGLARLATELDATYASGALWPRIDGGADVDHQIFGDGERAISIRHDRSYNWMIASVEGLAWGHQLAVHLGLGGGQQYLYGRLPDADIDRVLASHRR